LFALGGLGGLLVFWLRRSMPESMRWLIAKKQFSKAEEVLVKAEALAKKRIKGELPEVDKLKAGPAEKKAHIFPESELRNLFLFAAIWFFYYTGNYAWLTLDTKLFINSGFNLTSSIELVCVSSLGFLFGSAFSIWAGDRVERKITSIVLALIWTVLLLVIGWDTTKEMVMIMGFLAACSISFIIPTLYIYTSEQFPTPIRATCMSITDGIGHLGGAFCGQYTFYFYDLFKVKGFGIQAAFTALAATGLMAAILLMFGRRMTNKALA
jgi:putative MFS transporter